MRVSRLVCVVVVGLLARTSVASAQTAEVQAVRDQIDQLRKDFDTLKQQYGDRLAALEARLAAVQGQGATPAPPAGGTPEQPTAQVPPGAAGAGGPSGALPIYGAATAGSKIFNPDMAVIGDFLGAGGRNTINPDPTLQMHESEASFQAVVDPYARADFFMSFGEEGVELEEGYVTFPTLPGGLLMKAGKFRAAFGKVNTLHNHVLPWTDRPLVTANLLGGEDGINDAGLSVARLIPNPWTFLEAIGQVFRGDSADLFHSDKRGHLSYVGHVRGYQDLSESWNIDLGGSYSRGHTAIGELPSPLMPIFEDQTFITNLYGFDATLRWKPLQRAIYHSFVGRSEIVWSRRDQPGGLQKAKGFYVSGDYQFARRWFIGGRYDQSDRSQDASLEDKGGSAILTYWPSEFSQVRGQYRHTKYAEGADANEFLFQFQFSIGAHGAHPF
jgi:hypothetical protein